MGKVYGIFKIILRTLLIVAVGGLLVYNVYILIARSVFGNGMPAVFGVSFATVVSGSMADEIEIGDFIVVQEQEEYYTGDVITFYDAESQSYITHRIILVSGDSYATKGDANNAADDFSVPKEAVVGKVVAVWKGFGNVVTFLQSPLGLFCAIGGGIAVWILLDIVTEVVQKKQDGRENGGESKN